MRSKIEKYIRKWERQGYPLGIPDEADARLEAMNKVPSYRQIVRAIMRNDVALTSIGYSKEKCDSYIQLKRIEIEQRKIKKAGR